MLNPRKNEITKVIEYNNSKDGGFIERNLYNPCLKFIEKENYSTIKRETVYGPIKMFLLNWGRMGRVLERPDKRGWEDRLVKKIPELSDKLEMFRKMKLDNTDLAQYEDDIKTCYQQICNIVAPTSATKTLHLLCPEFFPLWDENIRNKAREEDGRRGWTGLKGYYYFMEITQGFLKKHNEELSALSKKHDRPKLKITDEYFFCSTR